MNEVQNNTERIVLFLDENDERAWEAATIADRLDLDTDAVSAILSRLKERDLVRHKGSYWTITDDGERLQAAYRLHRHHKTQTVSTAKNAWKRYKRKKWKRFRDCVPTLSREQLATFHF